MLFCITQRFSACDDALACGKLDVSMARGWESKDVESQVASKETMAAPGKAPKTGEQGQKDRERANIELSRKHILNDLETATHPNHKKTLEAALAHLDEKLGQLD
jgi:hypothetical protein